ncbi:hypothetical protein COO60DRAFT_1475997 [Scenedesmus sp. NREL 46B-D3]|nr:hypothetical protein COO60DRAFT_1475997 [Scenedesmus sp. NREL 46B-D3]
MCWSAGRQPLWLSSPLVACSFKVAVSLLHCQHPVGAPTGARGSQNQFCTSRQAKYGSDASAAAEVIAYKHQVSSCASCSTSDDLPHQQRLVDHLHRGMQVAAHRKHPAAQTQHRQH